MEVRSNKRIKAKVLRGTPSSTRTPILPPNPTTTYVFNDALSHIRIPDGFSEDDLSYELQVVATMYVNARRTAQIEKLPFEEGKKLQAHRKALHKALRIANELRPALFHTPGEAQRNPGRGYLEALESITAKADYIVEHRKEISGSVGREHPGPTKDYLLQLLIARLATLWINLHGGIVPLSKNTGSFKEFVFAVSRSMKLDDVPMGTIDRNIRLWAEGHPGEAKKRPPKNHTFDGYKRGWLCLPR